MPVHTKGARQKKGSLKAVTLGSARKLVLQQNEDISITMEDHGHFIDVYRQTCPAAERADLYIGIGTVSDNPTEKVHVAAIIKHADLQKDQTVPIVPVSMFAYLRSTLLDDKRTRFFQKQTAESIMSTARINPRGTYELATYWFSAHTFDTIKDLSKDIVRCEKNKKATTPGFNYSSQKKRQVMELVSHFQTRMTMVTELHKMSL